ncbi:MAG: LON peptidase substrate-binding domain-containing protein, partial [Bacteroidales bacterium]|nr:LON peptidase substrate-binding domain-containing protein [Bacteroidales bacterium]
MNKRDMISDLIEELANTIEAETEFIPLIGKEEGETMQSSDVPGVLPVLPVRNNVLFPGAVLPITLTRDKSLTLIKKHYKDKTPIGVYTQRHKENEDPKPEDLYEVGTMAHILKTLKMPDGSTTVIIQGTRRIKMGKVVTLEPYMQAEALPYDDIEQKKAKDTKALLDTVRDVYAKVVKLSNHIPNESLFAIQNIENSDILVYFIAAGLEIEAFEKQDLLEKQSLFERATVLMNYLTRNKQMLELKRKIETKAEADISQQQKEFFLNQQLKTIQEELGGSGEQEIQELVARSKKKKWSSEIQAHFDKEVKKTQRIHTMSPDYSVQLNYLNTMLDLPWEECSTDNYDLDKARKVLDKDHYGLEKVKERILSYMAVLHLRGDMKAPILCLVGPPGVGKTSLGKSIARALGRSYVRMSLGGLHDEAEIRGHRKTYIGAMPGRVIQGMQKAGTSNPVFMLDEIDKISGMTANGDPSAALLELLDPEQNKAFHDNFLEVDYDLSRVLFIATANTVSSIHPALLDRMEIIEVPSYVMQEKLEIAKRHLVPKQLQEHGLKPKDMQFS